MCDNINEDIKLKFIKDLKGCEFYIPSYQRGYRWTEQEVKDLLDDIYEFRIGSDVNPQTYCLQPLIVKKRQDGRFEVVDGQQRLTTIFIFLKIAKRITEYEPYKLEFETREKSASFLQSLEQYDGNENDENIDYYHITEAYDCIDSWFNSKDKDGTPSFSVLSEMFNKIVNSVFFIWYELPRNVNPVEIFTRVNMGKIPLSNAELIKAIIFNRDNFDEDSERIQQELSLEWNRIERDLQDDSLWYFLLEDEKKEYKTRIDLLFDLLANKYNEKLPQESNIPEQSSNKSFLIFYAVYKNAKDKKTFVKELWQKVCATHERFLEWYRDLNKYHIVGFLISAGTKIEDIFKLTEGKKKSEILTCLVKLTKKHVTKKLKINTKEELQEINYDQNKKILRNLFLLFNIATLVCKNERQYRFPFDLYKKEKWDIEHIHATADESAEPDDYIGNLTLLPAKINRSYKDDTFQDKRKEIIEKDSIGKFIPLCTKNVFLKQYTSDIKNMEDWEDSDKEDYVEKMWSILDAFWKEEWKEVCVK